MSDSPPLLVPTPGQSLSPYKTQEPASMLWFERVNYIAVNIGLIAYGVHIVAFVMCIYYLVKEKTPRKNYKWFAFVLAVFICGTVNISIDMLFNQWAWIDFREFPGGPLVFLLTQQATPMNNGGYAVAILNGFLTDGLLIYRVYIVYQKFYVIVIPVLAWLATSVLGGLLVAQAVLPGSSIWANSTLNFSLPYFSLILALNIVLTGLLVGRLVYIRSTMTRALGSSHGDPYKNITAMVLESAIPYCIVSVVFLVPYAMQITTALLFLPLYVQVQCISPIVIIMRVARGRSWSKESVIEFNISQLRRTAGGSSNAIKFRSVTAVNSSAEEMAIEEFKARPGLNNSTEEFAMNAIA